MNANLHITVATVVEKDGKFLMVEEDSGGAIVINQPAGHVEDGESLIDAAVRETYEETGWRVQPTSVVSLYRWRHNVNAETFFRVTFNAKPLAYDNGSKLDDGILRAVWLGADELKQQPNRMRSPLVLRSIEDYLGNKRYPLDLLVDL
jgi:8-oxo-dGTP pyrophosphatase MutT (NUDIX family)